MLAVIIINSNKQKRLQINFRSLFIIFHVFSSSLWKYIFWFIFISLNFSLILVNLCVRISYHTLRNVALILLCLSVQFSSVAQSCPTLCDPMTRSMPGLPVHHQLPRVHSNSCQSSRWCHPAILSSVVPFSSCPQSLPASESFLMSQLFRWPKHIALCKLFSKWINK